MNNRRRLLIALGAGALTAPLNSLAQQQVKIHRIGFLGATSLSGYQRYVDALRAGLLDLGYVDGKNIVFELRWADGKYDRLPELAAELVRLNVDVLVTHGTPGTRAAKQATTTIPIVMATSGDVLATGVVTSLARRNGNITGNTFFSPEINAKKLQMLKEIVPQSKRVAVLLNPDNPMFNGQTGPAIQAVQTAARSLKVGLELFEARARKELDEVFSAIVSKRSDAVLVVDDALFTANVNGIAILAATHRLPVIGMMELANAGGLVGFGVNFLEQFRHAAYFVDRILKGAKPGDVPIEQPIKLELAINMATAKALGIKIPDVLLLRADKVIE
jgi:putative ABC transport system substrate-binding protein